MLLQSYIIYSLFIRLEGFFIFNFFFFGLFFNGVSDPFIDIPWHFYLFASLYIRFNSIVLRILFIFLPKL